MDEAEWREFFAMCQRVADWLDQHGAEIASMLERLAPLVEAEAGSREAGGDALPRPSRDRLNQCQGLGHSS